MPSKIRRQKKQDNKMPIDEGESTKSQKNARKKTGSRSCHGPERKLNLKFKRKDLVIVDSGKSMFDEHLPWEIYSTRTDFFLMLRNCLP